MSELWSIVGRTVLIGAAATRAQLPLAIFVGRGLARGRVPMRPLVQALVALPMFMPPVAVGLLLLLVLGPSGPLGGLTSGVLYTEVAAVLAAAVVAFPIFARHAQEAFEAVPVRLGHVSRSLGVSPWQTFWRVDLPLARRGLVAGGVLAFARGIAEYGATAVVAGVIPGHTETLSTGLMRRLMAGDDRGAVMMAGLSLVLGLVAVVVSEVYLRRGRA
jgi:molybdate transport system permease protein